VLRSKCGWLFQDPDWSASIFCVCFSHSIFTDSSLLLLLLQSCLEITCQSITSLEVTSPLDHNLEPVLPGAHTQLAASQLAASHLEILEGFQTSKLCTQKWEKRCVAREVVVTEMMERSNFVAPAQLIGVAATTMTAAQVMMGG
jgi:hypothetical protein